jgi:hypothetical protein
MYSPSGSKLRPPYGRASARASRLAVARRGREFITKLKKYQLGGDGIMAAHAVAQACMVASRLSHVEIEHCRKLRAA